MGSQFHTCLVMSPYNTNIHTRTHTRHVFTHAITVYKLIWWRTIAGSVKPCSFVRVPYMHHLTGEYSEQWMKRTKALCATHSSLFLLHVLTHLLFPRVLWYVTTPKILISLHSLYFTRHSRVYKCYLHVRLRIHLNVAVCYFCFRNYLKPTIRWQPCL